MRILFRVKVYAPKNYTRIHANVAKHLDRLRVGTERNCDGFCGQTLRLHAAGRTDTGVHATGQVVHVDLEKGRVWHVKKPLDAATMGAAAKVLVGHHDFTTFRDVDCQAKSPMKTLDVAEVWREGEEVRVAFAARSFLHRQVRSMTGSLAEVGAGRWTVDDLAAALDARDRKACGPVAPADGLYLAGVEY